jgi:hypothetical protein
VRRFLRVAQEGGGREEGVSSETTLENTGRSGGRLNVTPRVSNSHDNVSYYQVIPLQGDY